MIVKATLAVGAAVILAGAGITAAVSAVAPSLSFSGSTVTVVNAGVQEKVKFYDVTSGTVYLGLDKTEPYSYDLPAAVRRVQVRLDDSRLEAAVPTGEEPTGEPSPTEPEPTPTEPSGPEVAVDSGPGLVTALANAQPGQTVTLAPGTYDAKANDAFRWEAAANGTAAEPITLTGPSSAVLTNNGPRGNYGLWVTGDHWRITGLTIQQATKGIVLDHANHAVIDGVTVRQIGEEGIHFRSCSSDGILRNSLVEDTGLNKPQYGEGVYVGSANSNWGSYNCDDGRDNSERALIVDNVFRNIAAEGADLKEGTESGTLRGNVFDNAGFGGENSADSAVDAKGNDWLIEANRVINPSGAFLDAFQTHSVYGGYGTGNVFRGNTVEGSFPGFGFGLYPAAANVVSCDNTAPGAAKGLVGANSKPATCQ